MKISSDRGHVYLTSGASRPMPQKLLPLRLIGTVKSNRVKKSIFSRCGKTPIPTFPSEGSQSGVREAAITVRTWASSGTEPDK